MARGNCTILNSKFHFLSIDDVVVVLEAPCGKAIASASKSVHGSSTWRSDGNTQHAHDEQRDSARKPTRKYENCCV